MPPTETDRLSEKNFVAEGYLWLAWEAQDLYGGQRQVARIKDPALQSQYMDLLYGDPGSRLTLGFTVARYNIAGGDDEAIGR